MGVGELLSGYKRSSPSKTKVKDVSDIELGLIFSIIKNAMPLPCGYASEEARYFHGGQPYSKVPSICEYLLAVESLWKTMTKSFIHPFTLEI